MIHIWKLNQTKWNKTNCNKQFIIFFSKDQKCWILSRCHYIIKYIWIQSNSQLLVSIKICGRQGRSLWSRGKVQALQPGGLWFESRLGQIVFQNFSPFAKSLAVFTVSWQKEGGSQGRMSVLNLIKKCQCQMLNIIMHTNI